MKLHDARRMWMQLGSALRQRVLDGETIKVAQRVPVPSVREMTEYPPKNEPRPMLAHTFHAIRTESIAGVIVTVFCDGEVIHVLREPR